MGAEPVDQEPERSDCEPVMAAHSSQCESRERERATSLPLYPLHTIAEDTVAERRLNFVIRSGEWSDIGERPHMEDTSVCIGDLAREFGCEFNGSEAVSFYGVFDGHGGASAAEFVRDNLPRVIVKDVDFPASMEQAVSRSFIGTDAALGESSLGRSSCSGTTAITALVFGKSLLVANVGDCRAVLSRRGLAVEMSTDHKTCCEEERIRVEARGGHVIDGYLNGHLSVTRALGDWHLEGMKDGPLSGEPEMKLVTLTEEDEFLIIGSDGVWDVFSNQNAVDFSRRKLQDHNDVKQCSREIVQEAIRRGSTDNLTAVVVTFRAEPPPQCALPRPRFRRSISAEGLQNLRTFLEM